MQLSARPIRLALVLAGLSALGPAGVAPARADALPDPPALSSLFRFFNDSKHVVVKSLMGDYATTIKGTAALSVHVNNEHVTIPAVSAPAGTQEAIDAITTASRPISGNAYQDYVKVRNEVQGGLVSRGRELDYYVSVEKDYLAQMLTAGYNRDYHDALLNIAFGTSYGWDAIKPLQDSDTNTGDATKRTMHWNVVATQVLRPTTVLRAGLEYNIVHGLQHNPYRNVYAGGTNVPERHPEERQRRDLFLKLNQYLGNRSSLKFNYRLYNDDWGVTSHELGADLSQYITHGVIVRYDYRYYTQTSADFWAPEYATIDGIHGYRTGDYRLGPLSSHLFGGTLSFDLAQLAAEHELWRRFGMSVNYERYFNNNNYSANIVETALDFRF